MVAVAVSSGYRVKNITYKEFVQLAKKWKLRCMMGEDLKAPQFNMDKGGFFALVDDTLYRYVG